MKKTTAALLAALMLCAPALAMEIWAVSLWWDRAPSTTREAWTALPRGCTSWTRRRPAPVSFAGNASLLAGNDQTLLVQDLGQDAEGGLVLAGAGRARAVPDGPDHFRRY